MCILERLPYCSYFWTINLVSNRSSVVQLWATKKNLSTFRYEKNKSLFIGSFHKSIYSSHFSAISLYQSRSLYFCCPYKIDTIEPLYQWTVCTGCTWNTLNNLHRVHYWMINLCYHARGLLSILTYFKGNKIHWKIIPISRQNYICHSCRSIRIRPFFIYSFNT